MNIKVDLLKAIQSQPFAKIKELIGTKGIPVDNSWLDYAALNISLEYGRKDVAAFLLEKNCRVNKVSRLLTKPSSTPLHKAVKLGDLELVQKLLEKNASMTVVNAQGDSPLHLAFLLKHNKITDLILNFILQTATFANPANDHGLTHFHIACARNHASLVLGYTKIKSNLDDSVNQNSPYFAGYTVVQFAIESKSPLILKLLLQHGGDLLSDNFLADALELAKKYQEDMSVMVHLLSSYAPTKSPSALSQFHLASMQNNPALLNNFLSYGAVANSAVSDEASFCPLYTPLHFAVETNCKENVQILLQHGADSNLQNAHYMTPLHLALYNDNQEIVDLLYMSMKSVVMDRVDRNGLSYFHVAVARNDLEAVGKFLERGQDVNCRVFHNNRNFSGYTPLHFAVRYAHEAIVRLLIERGANANANDLGEHGTPLHMAVAAGHRELMELLLKIGVRVDVKRSADNKSVLHLLVETYMEEADRRCAAKLLLGYVERFVLDYGLDVNAKDNDGYTALHYACTKISVGADCAKMLLELGADINVENNLGETPFELSFYDVYRSNAKDYLLMYNHVKDLATLGMTVNPKNEECCQKLVKEKDECQRGAECFRTMNLVKRQQESINEILKLKEAMISKTVSVYQFILMDEMQLRNFGGTDTLRMLVEGKMINDFVHFGYMIKLQWHRLKKLVANATFS